MGSITCQQPSIRRMLQFLYDSAVEFRSSSEKATLPWFLTAWCGNKLEILISVVERKQLLGVKGIQSQSTIKFTEIGAFLVTSTHLIEFVFSSILLNSYTDFSCTFMFSSCMKVTKEIGAYGKDLLNDITMETSIHIQFPSKFNQ